MIFRIGSDGQTAVWTRSLPRYPNGCCFSQDGKYLYVVESCTPGVSRVPVLADGSAGEPQLLIEMSGTVPDGIAMDMRGNLYIACYRPDRIYRFTPAGNLEILADDPTGVILNTPTNIAFAGHQLNLMVVANVGEWHLLIGDIGRTGAPLFYPEF